MKTNSSCWSACAIQRHVYPLCSKDWVAVKEFRFSYHDEYSRQQGFPKIISEIKFLNSNPEDPCPCNAVYMSNGESHGQSNRNELEATLYEYRVTQGPFGSFPK